MTYVFRFFPDSARTLTVVPLGFPDKRETARSLVFSFFFFSFSYFLAAVVDFLLGLIPVQKILRKHHVDVMPILVNGIDVISATKATVRYSRLGPA